MTLPAEVGEGMPDGVVWVPANSFGNGVLADLASPGSRVAIREADVIATGSITALVTLAGDVVDDDGLAPSATTRPG